MNIYNKNTSKTYKMAKIPLTHSKMTKIPKILENDQNTLKDLKMTDILSKTSNITKIPLKPLT